MGLIAIDRESGHRIEATQFESSHQVVARYGRNLYCPNPDCLTSVFPRSRKGFILHFVHVSTCKTQYGYHPESPEHLKGKMMIADYLKNDIARFTTAEVRIEHPLKEAGEHGRIADVALIYPSGNLLIGEVQLANITARELEARTNDYASIGADVIWFLGGSADTPDNRHWCIRNFGVHYTIDFRYTDPTIDIVAG